MECEDLWSVEICGVWRSEEWSLWRVKICGVWRSVESEDLWSVV